jgi:O-antigen ligase
VAVGQQVGAYLAFALVVVWALAGFRFTRRREDAAWLLHPLAVGAACLCAVSLVSIVSGRAEVAVSTPLPGSAQASEISYALPNWGVEGVLLFGYCWFLARTLTRGRLFSWPTVGLLACGELWAHLTKSTIFAIIPATLVILLLLVRKGKRSRVLVSMAVILGLVAAGAMIANTLSHGVLADRVTDYLAQRFFHVESLRRTGGSLNDVAVTASAQRLNRIWPEALQRFAASPVFGCGFNQDFSEEFDYFIPIHNAYLDVLVGVGLIGALPVVLAFLRWVSTVRKGLRLPENAPILVPCLGYAVCFCAINAGDLLRYFFAPMMLFGLILGITMKIALLPPEHGGSRRNWQNGGTPPLSD